MESVSGLWVPLVTPFDTRGEVDLDALRTLADEMLDDGIRGLVALGTTGEPTSLTERERAHVVAICSEVAVARGAGLMVAAGTNDTRTTLARHDALSDIPGVTAALTVVPYYVRPSESAIVTHLMWVADRSPVPLVVYNVPARTGRGLGGAALLELAEHPNVVGVKQAVDGVDLDTLTVLSAERPDFAVLAGEDAFLGPLLLLGAAGGITASAHLVTSRFVELVDDARCGHVDSVRRHAASLLPLVTALFAEPNPSVVKAVLHQEGRIPSPDVRMPLAPASRLALDDALRALPDRALAP